MARRNERGSNGKVIGTFDDFFNSLIQRDGVRRVTAERPIPKAGGSKKGIYRIKTSDEIHILVEARDKRYTQDFKIFIEEGRDIGQLKEYISNYSK